MKYLKFNQLVLAAFAFLSLGTLSSCDDDDDNAITTFPLESNTVTVRNTYEDLHVPEISFASYLDYAFTGSDVEFPEALKVESEDQEKPLINGLYSINFTGNTITYTLLPDSDDEFWKTNYRTLEEGVNDRYYLTFKEAHNVASFTASDPAINVRIDSDNVLVVEVGEGFEFQPGAAFTINLGANDTAKDAIAEGAEITMRNTFEDAHVAEISFASYVDLFFGTSLGEDGLDVKAAVVYEGVALGEAGLDLVSVIDYSSVEFPEALKADLSSNGAFLINGLYAIDFTESTIEYTLLPEENDPFWITNYRVLEEGVYDRYYFTFANAHGVKSFECSNSAINVRVDSDNILVVEVREGFDFKPGAKFSITLK